MGSGTPETEAEAGGVALLPGLEAELGGLEENGPGPLPLAAPADEATVPAVNDAPPLGDAGAAAEGAVHRGPMQLAAIAGVDGCSAEQPTHAPTQVNADITAIFLTAASFGQKLRQA
jgi:hypothetical protein